MSTAISRSVAAAAAVLLVWGCATQTAENSNENVNARPTPSVSPTVEPSPSVTPSPSATPTTVATPTSYVEYENKAVGYRIQRPDKWYWQHYIRSQIGENSPLVDDYFMADRNTLPALGSEYLGRIVIEVSRRTAADVADSVASLTKTDATVGGITAARYEGIRNDETAPNQTTVVYQFVKNGSLYRLIYAMENSTPADVAVFEDVVKSFAFTQ